MAYNIEDLIKLWQPGGQEARNLPLSNSVAELVFLEIKTREAAAAGSPQTGPVAPELRQLLETGVKEGRITAPLVKGWVAQGQGDTKKFFENFYTGGQASCAATAVPVKIKKPAGFNL